MSKFKGTRLGTGTISKYKTKQQFNTDNKRQTFNDDQSSNYRNNKKIANSKQPPPPKVQLPQKFVDQMQKRKLLWGAKKSEDSAAKWGHAQFSEDQDGKVASKFMRLMGAKNSSNGHNISSTSDSNNTDIKTREDMFSTMEQQYEVARQVTHTMRGVGLGFAAQPKDRFRFQKQY